MGLRSDAKLAADQFQALEKLDAAEFPFVREKLLDSGELQVHEIDDVELEFKRYLALCFLSSGPVSMTSTKVDAFWHQFILFTREYREFCSDVFGQFIHHRPNTSYTPLDHAGVDNFRFGYEQYFGSPYAQSGPEVGSATCINRQDVATCYNPQGIWASTADQGGAECSDIGSQCHGDGSCGGDGE